MNEWLTKTMPGLLNRWLRPHTVPKSDTLTVKNEQKPKLKSVGETINNKHLLVFLAPNIIFIGQMEKDIGRGVSRVQYLSTADQ